jgi:hypothetical protein
MVSKFAFACDPQLETAWFQPLRALNVVDILVSKFASATATTCTALPPGDSDHPRQQQDVHQHQREARAHGGGRRALTPPDPQLKGAWYPRGFNPRTYQSKTRFQDLPFQNATLHRYTAGMQKNPLAPAGGAPQEEEYY